MPAEALYCNTSPKSLVFASGTVSKVERDRKEEQQFDYDLVRQDKQDIFGFSTHSIRIVYCIVQFCILSFVKPLMATIIGGSDDGQGPFNSDDNVGNILSKELLELSFKDRNDIQEEIHGVHCIAPKETPEFIDRSLSELALALESEDFLPTHPKRAYRRSIEIQEGLKTETGNKSLYIHEDDFRLRFLRFELFDINKAARRIMIVLDLLVQFFGEYALERPIRLNDFSEEEIEYIKRGYIQFMPFRDRSGRRILSILPNDGWDFFPAITKVRFV